MDETKLRRRVITVSVPVGVDPALVLFSEGIEVRPEDDLYSVETSGNADVQIDINRAVSG